eukprot:5514838-Prymnesium_polylepis.1
MAAPDPAVDLPICLWSNARSPITEAHGILWGPLMAQDRESLVRRRHAPLWPNGSGASRSL